MPCALPPVDQSISQLGWHDGVFVPPRRTRSLRTSLDDTPRGPVFHSGWDFMADEGAPVVAAAAGTVVGIGRQLYGRPGSIAGVDALGNYVVVQHETPERILWTRYSHLSRASVRVGQVLNTGDLIGYVGTSGRAPANRNRPILYFQVVRPTNLTDYSAGLAVNPEPFFRERGVVLDGTAQTPGPPVPPYTQVPPWGGRLEQTAECRGGMGTALPSAGSGVQNPRYARFGQTRLTDNSVYAPAVYDEAARDVSLASSVFFWAAWLTGSAAAVWAIGRYVAPRFGFAGGLAGLGACPCDENPSGSVCAQLVRQALKKKARR